MTIENTPLCDVLSTRNGFGSVARCPQGCFHVGLPTLAFRLPERQFWTFVEMLNEAAERAGGGSRFGMATRLS